MSAPPLPRAWRVVLPVLLTGLVLVSLLAGVRTVLKTTEADGAFDLHPYWLAGHYLRAGLNPYLAFRDNLPLPGPVSYLDGSTAAAEAVPQPGLGRVPANTAPMLLLLTPLAWLPWPLAKSVWLLCNLILIGLIPWLVVRLLVPPYVLAPIYAWLTAFAFYAMKGPRESAASGQTSLLVFACMGVALLARRHELWAGLALGVALSKYSLALPVAIFLLLDRRWWALLVAAGVQIIALLVVAAPDGWMVAETVAVNLSMVGRHQVQVGIHLPFLLRAWPNLAQGVVVTGTLVVAGAVLWSWRRGWNHHHLLAVNSLMVTWLLVAVYHRNYDSLVVILFLTLCLAAATTWPLQLRQRWILGGVWLVSLGIMALPGEMVRPLVGDAAADLFMAWVDRAASLAVLLMVGVNIWLLAYVPDSSSRTRGVA